MIYQNIFGVDTSKTEIIVALYIEKRLLSSVEICYVCIKGAGSSFH